MVALQVATPEHQRQDRDGLRWRSFSLVGPFLKVVNLQTRIPHPIQILSHRNKFKTDAPHPLPPPSDPDVGEALPTVWY